MSDWSSIVWGVFTNFLTKFLELVWYCSFRKSKRLQKLDTQFHIINDQLSHKISNNVIYLDIDEKEFSRIANLFMELPENDRFIITNIKEPCWFYKQFKDHADTKKSLIELESNINDLNKANEIITKLINLFYNSNDIDIFPHLRSFVTSEAEKRVRINYFNLKLGNPSSRDAFGSRNKNHEVFFFEKFINHNVKSLYQNIDTYKGTDALILNEERILKHDDSINELHYQKNNFVNEIKKGFFYNVIKYYKDYENGKDRKRILTSTSEILKTIYSIHV